jgi:hypothetical protein
MDEFRHIIPFFIPIVAIVMGIGIGMLGLLLDYRKKSRMFELHHKERLLAIERGMEVPPLPAEFFVNQRKAPASYRSSSLRWGLIWLMLGFALAIVLLLNGGPEAASWALLPMALGVAQLIYFRMEKPEPEVVAPKQT